MVRRMASQVHQQVSRLMRGNYIREKPVWFQAVLDHPPLPLPPKAPPSRTRYDHNSSPDRHSTKPLPITYLEDYIRRQFFRDHPFETFRPISIVEASNIRDSHPIRHEAWTRLRQRSQNPSPEDAIQFTLNLHLYHSMPLSGAYKSAVAQFRALRSEHQVASTVAAMEAEYFGFVFPAGEIELAHEKEKRNLITFQRREELDEGAIAARKRWKAIFERTEGVKEWSKGVEYVRLWKDGIRPTYPITRPVSPSSPILEQVKRPVDILGIAS